MEERIHKLYEPRLEIMDEKRGEKYPYCCFLENNIGERYFVTPHYHYELELLYFIKGGAQIHFGQKKHLCKDGEMLLINSYEVHSILAPKGTETSYVVLEFRPSILHSTLGDAFESKYITPFTMEGSNIQRVFYRDELLGTPIPRYFEELLEEFNAREYGFELAVHAGILNIIAWILRNCYNERAIECVSPYSRNTSQKERYNKLFTFIEQNYAQNITSQTVKEVCHFNYAYFTRQFKLMTGRTFKEYLNFVRITNAESMLVNTNLDITSIALSCGFSDISYFIRQFKKHRRVTPSQFRKSFSTPP